MHEPSAVAAPLVRSLLGNWWDQNVLTFSMSPISFALNYTNGCRNLPFVPLSHPLSCCQNHVENIVYNWCLIAAVATVLFKPTHTASTA